MCTVATWKNNDTAIVTGRNMDWKEKMHTKLWVLPAGQERVGYSEGNNPLIWTSKYGSVVASVYDIATADGMNEKGLSAHVLWLAESDFGTPNATQPNLSLSLWAQYFLDNFALAHEAVAHINEHPFNLIPIDSSTFHKEAPTVHLILNDASGNRAVLEYLDGKLQIWEGEEYSVTTNSPTFDKQLENLKQYDGFGGAKTLPGTTEAADRFVRAAYYLQHLQQPHNYREVVAGVASVLRNAAQPFGTPDPDRPNISPTIWRTICDHTNLRYYFESSTSPSIVWVDFAALNLTPGAPTLMLDTEQNEDLAGEITKEFQAHDLFQFALS